MHAHIMSLQEQVDTLWHNLNSLRATLGHEIPQQEVPYNYGNEQARQQSAPQAPMVIDPVLNRSKASPQQSRFQGPTSSAYSFGIARSSLQHMGVTSPDDGLDASAESHDGAEPSGRTLPKGASTFLHPNLHAIASVSKEEALRLVQVYEDEMGLMYPILDIARIRQYAMLVFGLGDAAHKKALIVKGSGETEEDLEFDLLRLILAIALVCESNGYDALAKALYDGTSYTREDSLDGNIDIRRIQVMTLAVRIMFILHEDEDY